MDYILIRVKPVRDLRSFDYEESKIDFNEMQRLNIIIFACYDHGHFVSIHFGPHTCDVSETIQPQLIWV